MKTVFYSGHKTENPSFPFIAHCGIRSLRKVIRGCNSFSVISELTWNH